MLRITLLSLALGLITALNAFPETAAAAIWSVKADCSSGDWRVDVELDGFGLVDASCFDGGQTRLGVDVGNAHVLGIGAAATSSLGTTCRLPVTDDSKLVLKCESETEDTSGLELEEELEVELELEEADEDEVG